MISDAVSDLIEVAVQNRENFREVYCICPINWAKEFCTVHVNAGRRSGKTQYIKKHATSDDVVIVPDQNYKRIVFGGFNDARVLTIDEVFCMERLPKCNRIYVDEPQLCFKSHALEGLYERIDLRRFHETLVVLLGA